MKHKPKIKHVVLQIEALKELLKAYQEKRPLEGCPLCLVSWKIGLSKNCEGCPWVWITGMSCVRWNHKRNYTTIQKYKLDSPHEIKLRIRQIKMWIKILEKYIEENGWKQYLEVNT